MYIRKTTSMDSYLLLINVYSSRIIDSSLWCTKKNCEKIMKRLTPENVRILLKVNDLTLDGSRKPPLMLLIEIFWQQYNFWTLDSPTSSYYSRNLWIFWWQTGRKSCFYLSIYLSVYLCLSVCLSVYLLITTNTRKRFFFSRKLKTHLISH